MRYLPSRVISIVVLATQAILCTKSDQLWDLKTSAPVDPIESVPTFVKKTQNKELLEVTNFPVPVKIYSENKTEKYLSSVIELRDYKYLYYLGATENYNNEFMEMLSPTGPVVHTSGFHQTFIPISNAKISEILYSKEGEKVAMLLSFENMRKLFRNISSTSLIPNNCNFEDLGEIERDPEIKKVKIVLKKNIFVLEDVSKMKNGTCGNSKKSYPYTATISRKNDFLVRVHHSGDRPEKIYRMGAGVSFDTAQIVQQCKKDCSSKFSAALYDITSDEVIFPFYNDITQLCGDDTKISRIIAEEFRSNPANRKYVEKEKNSDEYIFPQELLLSRPLFKSPSLYASEENIKKNEYNLSAEGLIPLKILEKNFIVDLMSQKSSSIYNTKLLLNLSIESILSQGALEVFYNKNMLYSLLSIVDHLITSMRLQNNNWFAKQTLLGLTQAIRPGILYAIKEQESYAPLASSLYYYVVNIIYNQRKLHIIDLNLVFSMFKTMQAYSPNVDLYKKLSFEGYIISSPLFCHAYKRVVLGCMCTPDYSKYVHLGKLVRLSDNNEVFCSCWCTQKLVEENFNNSEYSYTLPSLVGEETEEEKKKKLALKKKSLNQKKSLPKSKPSSGLDSSTRSAFSIVAIVVSVVAVVSVVSYYIFFR